MYKIRLLLMGKSIQPNFRIVAMDSRKRRDGRYNDILGTYNPNGKTVINEELALKLLLTGAQPTTTVRNLLSKHGILTKFHDIKQSQKKAKKLSNEVKKVAKPKVEVKKTAAKSVTKKASATTAK